MPHRTLNSLGTHVKVMEHHRNMVSGQLDVKLHTVCPTFSCPSQRLNCVLCHRRITEHRGREGGREVGWLSSVHWNAKGHCP